MSYQLIKLIKISTQAKIIAPKRYLHVHEYAKMYWIEKI